MKKFGTDDWEYNYALRFWNLMESQLTRSEKQHKDKVIQRWSKIFHDLNASKEEITKVLYWLFNTSDGKWWVTDGPIRTPEYLCKQKGINTYFEVFLVQANKSAGSLKSLKDGDKITEDEYNNYIFQHGKKVEKYFISIGFDKNNKKLFEYCSDPEAWKEQFFKKSINQIEQKENCPE